MASLTSFPSSVVSAGTWATASNAYSSNDQYATNPGATQNTEYPMDLGGFNFSAIPVGSTLTTVTTTIEGKASVISRSQLRAEMYDGATPIPGVLNFLSVDSTTDVTASFTSTPTLAQLQSPNLKIRVIHKRVNASACTLSVDSVKIDVVYTPAAGASGRPRVWNGSAWVPKPMKVWNGSTWIEKPVKVWTGSAWKTVT